MVGAAGLVITVFIMVGNSALTRQVSPQSGGSFVNAVDSWYAIIVEGQLLLNQRTEVSVIPVTRWVQIYRDHPYILNLPMPSGHKGSEKFFSTHYLQLPRRRLRAPCRKLCNILAASACTGLSKRSRYEVLLIVLTLIGAGYALTTARRRWDPICGLLGITGVAILLSQPFLYGRRITSAGPNRRSLGRACGTWLGRM